MSESLTTLNARREQLARNLQTVKEPPAEVIDLVRQADAALGKMKAEVAAAEAELADVDAVIDIRERDRREAAQRQKQEQKAAKEAALLAEHEARLTAVADAEAATRTLVDAINRAIASNARMATLARELDPNGRGSGALNPLELVGRLANRMASVMGTIPGQRYRLGRIEWPGGASGLYPPDRNWRDGEDKQVAALINPLIKGA